jgi:hypothetical protein
LPKTNLSKVSAKMRKGYSVQAISAVLSKFLQFFRPKNRQKQIQQASDD